MEFSAKLASSTLTMDDAQALGFVLNPVGFVRAWPTNASFTIPYFDLKGDPLPDNPAWRQCPPYYRHRVLGSLPGSPRDVTGEGQAKYLCAPNTAPCAYYPRLLDWEKVAVDVEYDVIITEGELKAAAAAKCGFATIGLGGVSSWRSGPSGLAWILSLDLIEWGRRTVYICFDADYRVNPNVARELQALADAFQERGAICKLLSLPNLPDISKVGLDDFLLYHGAAGSGMLEHLLHTSERLGYAGELFRLNREYAVVKSMGVVAQVDSGLLMGVEQFKVVEGTRTVLERRVSKPVKDQPAHLEPKTVLLSKEWLTWRPRCTVNNVVYQPGSPRFTEEGDYNSWKGWGCAPVEGDVSLFLEFFAYLTRGCTPDQRVWLLRWLAYPLQHPGVKQLTAVVAYGPQGSGKGLLGDTMCRIYGTDNSITVEKESISSVFNTWQSGKQFVVGDELSGHDKRSDAEKLKKMITQTDILINEKYVKNYRVADTINYYFTSNHGNALFIEDSDRRFFVLEILTDNPEIDPGLEFFSRYDKWFKSPEGISALFHYLLNVELGSYNPMHPAPLTHAKELMRESGRSDVSEWAHRLLESPDEYLVVGGIPLNQDVYSAHDLLVLYANGERTKVTAGGIGRELSAAKAIRAHRGGLLQAKGVRRDRYWIIRNPEKWKDASHAEIVAHLVENAPENKGKRF